MSNQIDTGKAPTEAALFQKLRRLAQGSGFDVKTRHGGYMLVNAENNTLIAGDRYQLDLKDVAKELQKLHVLGYGR